MLSIDKMHDEAIGISLMTGTQIFTRLNVNDAWNTLLECAYLCKNLLHFIGRHFRFGLEQHNMFSTRLEELAVLAPFNRLTRCLYTQDEIAGVWITPPIHPASSPSHL
jgi:hypothetical protein